MITVSFCAISSAGAVTVAVLEPEVVDVRGDKGQSEMVEGMNTPDGIVAASRDVRYIGIVSWLWRN